MATPREFDEQNRIYKAAPEDRETVGDLPVWEGFLQLTTEEGPASMSKAIVSCWELSEAERARIAAGDPLYLVVMSSQLPPMYIGTDKPIMALTPNELLTYMIDTYYTQNPGVVANSQVRYCIPVLPDSFLHITNNGHKAYCGQEVFRQGDVYNPDEQNETICPNCFFMYQEERARQQAGEFSLVWDGNELIQVYARLTFASHKRESDNIHFAIKGEDYTICNVPVQQEIEQSKDPAQGANFCQHCMRIVLKR